MFYEPPYFLLLAGLLMGVTSGKAFEETLKQSLQEWSQSRSSRILQQLQGISLTLPFFGVCTGVCIFLASGLSIYGIPTSFSYSVSIPLTILTAALVWNQLQKLLLQLEQGGSKSIDLDTLE